MAPMPSIETLVAFFGVSVLLALTPGPDNIFVLLQSAQRGWRAGMCVVLGLCLGLVGHTAAVALGLAAVFAASGMAFTVLKVVGAVYLIWLGIKTWREANVAAPIETCATGAGRAVREGILVETLNPKTAAFFLAFIPQFVDPAANVAGQFAILGLISVVLNTLVDVVVTYWAAMAREGLAKRPSAIAQLRQASGAVMCGLGALLMLAKWSA